MRQAIWGLVMMMGCAAAGPFEGGNCVQAGTPGSCGDGRIAVCGAPVCDGEGWYEPNIFCSRGAEGRDGRPYCADAAEESCYSEEEIAELCAVD
jgi:hypothetical protein